MKKRIYKFPSAAVLNAAAELDAQSRREFAAADDPLALLDAPTRAEMLALAAAEEERKAFWTAVFYAATRPGDRKNAAVRIRERDILRPAEEDHGDDMAPF